VAAAVSAGGDAVPTGRLGRAGWGLGLGAAKGVDDGEQGRGDEDSPGWDEDAEHDGAEECGPPGDAGGAVEDVGSDDEAFEDGDEAIETEDVAEAVPVVAGLNGERGGQDGTNDGEHATEAGDELAEGSDDGPEGGEGDVEEFEADEPEAADDEGVEGGGAAPVEEGSAGGAERMLRLCGPCRDISGQYLEVAPTPRYFAQNIHSIGLEAPYQCRVFELNTLELKYFNLLRLLSLSRFFEVRRTWFSHFHCRAFR